MQRPNQGLSWSGYLRRLTPEDELYTSDVMVCGKNFVSWPSLCPGRFMLFPSANTQIMTLSLSRKGRPVWLACEDELCISDELAIGISIFPFVIGISIVSALVYQLSFSQLVDASWAARLVSALALLSTISTTISTTNPIITCLWWWILLCEPNLSLSYLCLDASNGQNPPSRGWKSSYCYHWLLFFWLLLLFIGQQHLSRQRCHCSLFTLVIILAMVLLRPSISQGINLEDLQWSLDNLSASYNTAWCCSICLLWLSTILDGSSWLQNGLTAWCCSIW